MDVQVRTVAASSFSSIKYSATAPAAIRRTRLRNVFVSIGGLDADGSGAVNGLTDGLFLFRWAFQSGDAPPDPR